MTFSSTCRKNPTARVYFIVISLIAEIKKLDILSLGSTVVVVVVVVISQSSQTAAVILRRRQRRFSELHRCTVQYARTFV
jgi:hypothetical protein|tara:strand:+ start:1018 stop:1257 length:240 start_codon:yes stop_codon:yes gene_type:complete